MSPFNNGVIVIFYLLAITIIKIQIICIIKDILISDRLESKIFPLFSEAKTKITCINILEQNYYKNWYDYMNC